MSLRTPLVLLAALAALAVGAPLASAQSLPTSPGDFQVDMGLAGAPDQGKAPTCDPSLDALAVLFMGGQSTAAVVCTGSASQETTKGTVSNPTLAASTGDAGFNTGTIEAVCDSSQTSAFTLALVGMSTQLTKFSGTAWYACSFTMTFQDAQASSLFGTIEVNATLGKGDGTMTGSTIDIEIAGEVYVLGGSGVFQDAQGDGTFTQQQSFEVPSAAGTPGAGGGGVAAPTAAESAVCGAVTPALSPCTSQAVDAVCQAAKADPMIGPLCTAAGRRLHLRITPRAGTPSSIALKLKQGKGSARILVPAPPAGKPGGKATVKAKTKVRMTASTGAQCTVKASTGAVVGTGTAKGKYGAISIRPKADAYAGAKWIKATCTKSGKTFSSNKVKIALK